MRQPNLTYAYSLLLALLTSFEDILFQAVIVRQSMLWTAYGTSTLIPLRMVQKYV